MPNRCTQYRCDWNRINLPLAEKYWSRWLRSEREVNWFVLLSMTLVCFPWPMSQQIDLFMHLIIVATAILFLSLFQSDTKDNKTTEKKTKIESLFVFSFMSSGAFRIRIQNTFRRLKCFGDGTTAIEWKSLFLVFEQNSVRKSGTTNYRNKTKRTPLHTDWSRRRKIQLKLCAYACWRHK